MTRLPSAAAIALAFFAAGCGSDAAPPAAAAPIVVTDDGGHTVRLARPAARIVSLVPSATDVLLALGAETRLVGRTRYDTDPAVARVPSVGGGLDPSVEAILALRPDLVLSWETDRGAHVRAALEAAGVPVVGMWANDTGDVYTAVERIGRLTGRDSAAAALVAATRATLDSVRRAAAGDRRAPEVLYVVSTSPPMVAGPTLFAGQLVGVAGGRLAFAELAEPSPTVSIEAIVARDPDVVVLPVGEDPVRSLAQLRAMTGWRDLRAVREGRVVTVPALLTNRPGPRMGETARVLREGIVGAMGGSREP